MMKKLVKRVVKLKKTNVKKIVDRRIKEFKKIGKSPEKIFQELCFCILTANFNAAEAIKIQNTLAKQRNNRRPRDNTASV